MQISIILIKTFSSQDPKSLDHIKLTPLPVAMIKSVKTNCLRITVVDHHTDHHPFVQVDPVVCGVHPGGADLHHHRVDEERQSPRILAGNKSHKFDFKSI